MGRGKENNGKELEGKGVSRLIDSMSSCPRKSISCSCPRKSLSYTHFFFFPNNSASSNEDDVCFNFVLLT